MGAGPIIRRAVGVGLIALGALYVLSYGAACGYLHVPLICDAQVVALSFGSLLIIVGFVMML